MTDHTNYKTYFRYKTMQSGGFLGKLLEPLMKVSLSIMKNMITLLTASVLIPLGLTAAVST